MFFEEISKATVLAWIVGTAALAIGTADCVFMVLSAIGLICMAGMEMFDNFKEQ